MQGKRSYRVLQLWKLRHGEVKQCHLEILVPKMKQLESMIQTAEAPSS